MIIAINYLGKIVFPVALVALLFTIAFDWSFNTWLLATVGVSLIPAIAWLISRSTWQFSEYRHKRRWDKRVKASWKTLKESRNLD